MMRERDQIHNKKATDFEDSNLNNSDAVSLLSNCIDYPISTLLFILKFFPKINTHQMENTKHISYNTAEIYTSAQLKNMPVDATTLTISSSNGKSLAVNILAIPSETKGFIFAVASLFTSTAPISK